MDEMIINDAFEFVRNTFKDDYSGHDYFHALRVYKMATRIAEQEDANLIVVQLAVLLHDVDDIKLSPETCVNKDRAAGFLRRHGISEAMIKTICNIIDEVSFRETDSTTPETIEGECVQDADRLDAMGAIGIARAFAYGGNHNRVIYDPEIKPTVNMNADQYQSHISTTINHFYEKLFQLKDLMNTDTAKKIAGQLRLLWGICLMVEGVCAVVLGVLSIMDVKLGKELVPVLCPVMLLTISGTCVLTAQLMKRQKKK